VFSCNKLTQHFYECSIQLSIIINLKLLSYENITEFTYYGQKYDIKVLLSLIKWSCIVCWPGMVSWKSLAACKMSKLEVKSPDMFYFCSKDWLPFTHGCLVRHTHFTTCSCIFEDVFNYSIIRCHRIEL
jgi:hypothetical protein